MSIGETDGREGLPDGFLDLPGQVYAGDPRWIPEVASDVARAFSSANAWFARNRARALCIEGAVRAAVFSDPACVVDGERAAFFGFWESTGDARANALLMARVESWAREQGAERLFGPINFTTYQDYRLLLSAEEGALPFPGEPYNPARYPTELEALGFGLHQRYLTLVGRVPEPALQMMRAYADQLRDEGYRFEPLTVELWMAHLREIHALVDDIFGHNFAYTPLSFESFAAAAGESMVAKSCPRSSTIAWAPDGGIAGIALAYPHYGPLVNQGAGAARVAVSELRYEQHMPLLRALGPVDGLMKTMGTHPAHRRRNIQTIFAGQGMLAAPELYARWMAPLFREGNPSGRVATPFGKHKRYYGLYSKPLR